MKTTHNKRRSRSCFLRQHDGCRRSVSHKHKIRMTKKINYILVLLFLPLSCLFGQVEVDKYAEKCDFEFMRLSGKLPDNRRQFWEAKSRELNAEYVNIGNQVGKSKSAYEEINATDVYAFQYLKQIYSFLIPEKTNLVNAVGKELLDLEIGNEISIRIDSLGQIFNEYANSNNADSFQSSYNRFLILKNQILEAKNENIILFYTVYKPRESAYSNPSFIKEFKVYDWDNKIKKLTELNTQLKQIEIMVQTKKYEIIKDPIPVIPIMLQFSTLFIVIPSLLVNFGFELKKSKIILVMVVVSLITSTLLLFISSSTIFNSIINVFVPGTMYLIYYRRNRKMNQKENGHTTTLKAE